MPILTTRFRMMLKRHMKAIAVGVPTSIITIVEARDMYERSQWEHADGLDQYRTGDIVMISHRWFALPSWPERIYSLLSKVMMRSSWDDVGIIVSNSNDVPHILRCGYYGVTYAPLADFLGAYEPRGCAIRELSSLQAQRYKVTDADVDAFARAQLERRPTPWSLLWGAVEDSTTTKHYRYAVQASELAWEVRKMMGDGSSREAIEVKREKLHDTILMEQELTRNRKAEDARPHRRLFNSSLVAECLQEMKLLPEPFPEAYRYGPQDFAWRLPLVNANLGEPVIVFKS
uniref:Uncharacterized protein n=1 Tax=Neobodo designis TaxID=312471 RepID=A0A7S1LYC1_NEODS|mmetsp:Transcript_30843/g.95253  ORF Transcript_30843/g.95253 Transcript_30843/m.95253 type:complete len:288 (+) Transcript_30843:142-1005(+)|eukprot:CAMPEP_0174834782 /NCGR_PEP_ID=MMETSP1114-20130205/5043_1 /TAXON_ID=312471 /ORGANISM="Neobodo designis, Strain CCAP 1951/1" /LENGTH=287 /DNA_ID=CAMNT_0016068711 /DNA_START=138 /DNA_END=1001 /DNA_ORIENTATION=-